MATHALTTPPTLTRRRPPRAAPDALDRRPAPPPGNPPQQGSVRPTAAHFFGGVIVPDAYGSPLRGSCLDPEICDGDMALVSPSEVPQAGDFVVLHFTAGGTPWMKRLVMAPMLPVGTKLRPDSDVLPMIVVEMLNPPRQFVVTTDKLTAMHRVVGLIRKADVSALRTLKASKGRKAGVA